ncbi:MAG: alginate export family protein [Planctomycetota bacterium]
MVAVCWGAVALLLAVTAQGDELLDPIVLTPPGGDDVTIRFGGQVRQQYEAFVNPDFGASPEDDGGYWLQRYVLDARVTAGDAVTFFFQLYSAPAADRTTGGGPFDEDPLRVQQAYVTLVLDGSDASSTTQPDGGASTLSVGRQELRFGTQRLISNRAGPNVRRAFDAVRVTVPREAWVFDALLARPVEVDPEPLRDWGDGDEALWGLYATRDADVGNAGGSVFDLYYLGFYNADAVFDTVAGQEVRHTLGARARGVVHGLAVEAEAAVQLGSIDGDAIFAYTLALDATAAMGRPTDAVGLRFSLASGDHDADDDQLNTFNPLYPRGSYFGESAIVGPYNLIHLQPYVETELLPGLTLEAGWSVFWRLSEDDGFYNPGGGVIRSGLSIDDRFIGSELSLVVSYPLHPNAEVSAGYARFFAGDFIEATGESQDVDFFQATVELNF